MTCPECGGEQRPLAVPPDLRDLLPGDPAAVAVCERCLHTEPADDADAPAAPDLSTVSDAIPADPEAAVPLVLAVGLLSSLALHREAIATLLERVERAGTDPLLALDRLADDPDLDPAVDLKRRRHQLEQLL